MIEWLQVRSVYAMILGNQVALQLLALRIILANSNIPEFIIGSGIVGPRLCYIYNLLVYDGEAAIGIYKDILRDAAVSFFTSEQLFTFRTHSFRENGTATGHFPFNRIDEGE